MSLVQLNAIREIVEDAKQRLGALDTTGFPPPAINAINQAAGFADKTIGATSRAEQRLAQKKADDLGDTS